MISAANDLEEVRDGPQHRSDRPHACRLAQEHMEFIRGPELRRGRNQPPGDRRSPRLQASSRAATGHHFAKLGCLHPYYAGGRAYASSPGELARKPALSRFASAVQALTAALLPQARSLRDADLVLPL